MQRVVDWPKANLTDNEERANDAPIGTSGCSRSPSLGCAASSLSFPWLCSAIQLAGSGVEIPEQGRTQPTFHIELRRIIPIASILLASPLQLDCVTGKWR